MNLKTKQEMNVLFRRRKMLGCDAGDIRLGNPTRKFPEGDAVPGKEEDVRIEVPF